MTLIAAGERRRRSVDDSDCSLTASKIRIGVCESLRFVLRLVRGELDREFTSRRSTASPWSLR